MSYDSHINQPQRSGTNFNNNNNYEQGVSINRPSENTPPNSATTGQTSSNINNPQHSYYGFNSIIGPHPQQQPQQHHHHHHQYGSRGIYNHQPPSDYDDSPRSPHSSSSDDNTAHNDSDEETATGNDPGMHHGAHSARMLRGGAGMEGEDGENENDEIITEREHVRALLNKTNRTGLVPGQYYYLLETNWWRNWCGYVGYTSFQRAYRFQHSPGPIDNSGLVDDTGEVKRTKIEDTDYVFVPKDVWEYIIERYGGGPAIPRLCVKGTRSPASIEVRKLPVKVIWSRKPKEQIPAFFSKGTTIGQFLDEMSKKIKFDRANIRVYDFHNGSKIRLLDDMNTIFSDVPIVENQPILIEQRTKQGLWPNDKIYLRFNHFQTMRYPPSPPGKTGLQNLGNTCFMASSLQCLSQTIPLVDYFLTRNFVRDINRTNPLGQKGELAEQYFDLLKDLWSASTSVIEPRLFKKAIEKCDQRFAGYQQHDSQELLIFLLDGIHEDLNRVKNKPYVEKVEGDGTKDEDCANAAWAGHKARNNSIIVDNFQGLLKSTLTCPINGRVSTTFDPFMYLTVPIPIQSTRKIPIILYRLQKGRKPMKYGITVDKEGTIVDLTRELSKLSSIPAENLAILEVYGYKFYKHFTDKDELSDIRETDKIYAYEIKLPTKKIPKIKKIDRAEVPDIPSPRSERETPQEPNDHPYNDPREFSSNTTVGSGNHNTTSGGGDFPPAGAGSSSEDEEEEEIYHLPVLWKKLDGYSSSLFGVPFILSVSKTVTYQQLYRSLIDSITYYLTQSPSDTPTESDEEGSNSDPEDGTKPLKYFFQITKQSTGYDYEPNPRKEEKTLVKNKQTIIMEWTKQNYKIYYNKTNENDYDTHPSLNSSSNDENSEISLNDCLLAFTKQEQLGPDDPWYCNDCKEFRQAFKKFDIWSAPPILIIHLKRFSYRGRFSFREKLDNLISFPLTDLDLSQFIIGPSPVPPIYDLYAISNHFGSLGGGHYTAYCKHRDDGQWYLYDDSSVRPVPTSQVLSPAAYVLFYHRKDITWPPFDRSLDVLVPEEEEGSDTEEESSDSHHGESENHNNSNTTAAVDAAQTSTNPFDNITPTESNQQIVNNYIPPAGFEEGHIPASDQQPQEEKGQGQGHNIEERIPGYSAEQKPENEIIDRKDEQLSLTTSEIKSEQPVSSLEIKMGELSMKEEQEKNSEIKNHEPPAGSESLSEKY